MLDMNVPGPSASGSVTLPTAVHALREVQDTPRSSPVQPRRRAGVRCNNHREPFQRSINGESMTPTRFFPTAAQADLDVHDTPCRTACREPAGTGTGRTTQPGRAFASAATDRDNVTDASTAVATNAPRLNPAPDRDAQHQPTRAEILFESLKTYATVDWGSTERC